MDFGALCLRAVKIASYAVKILGVFNGHPGSIPGCGGTNNTVRQKRQARINGTRIPNRIGRIAY
jgi:hypothetical protein